MADSKNLTIGLLLLIIILLAVLIFRSMMYSPVYNPAGYPSGKMGPGMMHNPGYNYTYGSGMMGNMMAVYYSESRPIAQDEALKIMQNFARKYSSNNTEIEDFMVFSSNYYAVLKDPSTGQYIAEILVDRYSGSAYPEPGPNMMWNTNYGAGRAQTGGKDYDLAESEKLANDFLAGYLPGAQIIESKAMPGYYTFDFGRNGIESMLSVNAYSGQLWVHTWHGPYIGDINVTS